VDNTDVRAALASGAKVEVATAIPGDRIEDLPLPIDRLLRATGVQILSEEQFSRYFRLLFASWLSDTPGFLPNITDALWRIAGAPSRKAFEAEANPILRLFERTIDDKYLFVRWLVAAHARKAAERAGRAKGGRNRQRSRRAGAAAGGEA
jgi:uncharacterized protein YdaU (DUF1376 family)